MDQKFLEPIFLDTIIFGSTNQNTNTISKVVKITFMNI